MDAQFALHLDVTRPHLSRAGFGDEERAVADALRWGRANALQVREIARLARLPMRRTQDVIDRLLREHGWPIGTSMAEPFGNYLIDSAEELEATVELLRTRGISNLTRAAALKGMSLRRFIESVQPELFHTSRG